jgi:hypothetical protein
MLQRAGALVVIAAALVAAGVGISRNLFAYGSALEALTDGLREPMSDDALVATRREMIGLEAVAAEVPHVIEGLAAIYEVDAEALPARLAGDAPAFAAGLEGLPAATARFAPLASELEAQQANLEAADGIPLASVAAASLPWMTFGVAAGLALSGLAMLTRRPIGAWTAAALGLVVIAATTSAGLIPKTGDLDQMNAAFRPWYSVQFVSEAEQALGAIIDMGRDLDDRLLPALAEQLEVAVAEADDYFTETYPATEGTLRRLPDDITRLSSTIEVLAAGRNDYDTVAETTLAPLGWTILVAGIVAAVFGTIGAMGPRRLPGDGGSLPRGTTAPPGEAPPALDLPSIIPGDGPSVGA